jgi:cell division septal protein FtsQ
MSNSRGNLLKFEAEFFRKSNNLTLTREKKIRSIQMRTVHILLLLFFTLGVGFTIYKSALFLLQWDTLRIHTFRLRQPPLYAKGKVREILKRSAGNILALDLGELRAQLLRLPEVADVAISRILPDVVEIGFTLRQPFFYLDRNGIFQLLDASGLVLGEQGAMPVGPIPIRANDDGPAVAQIAAAAQELLPLRSKLEYVAFCEPYGIELKLLAEPEVFYPGESGFSISINRYLKIRPHLVANGALVRYVDLRIAGRIYIGYFDEPQGDS